MRVKSSADIVRNLTSEICNDGCACLRLHALSRQAIVSMLSRGRSCVRSSKDMIAEGVIVNLGWLLIDP